MGWAAVIGLGGLSVGLWVYAEVGGRKGIEGLWGARLVAALLLALCGMATLRATSVQGLGLHRLFSVYTLVIVAGAAGCWCTVKAAVRKSREQEAEFWAWSAAASVALAVMFFGLLFTASIEESGMLLVACFFFACWGVAGLFLRLVVYR